jgi:hypothetical protein
MNMAIIGEIFKPEVLYLYRTAEKEITSNSKEKDLIFNIIDYSLTLLIIFLLICLISELRRNFKNEIEKIKLFIESKINNKKFIFKSEIPKCDNEYYLLEGLEKNN